MEGGAFMSIACRYGFGADVALEFDATIEKLEELLGNRGFNIATRLRMDDILKEETQESFGRYIIFGACNPEYAGALFKSDPNIGLMMPCNVVVYELKSGGCRVMIKDPVLVMDLSNSPLAIEASIKVKEQLEEIAEEIGNLGKPSLLSRMNPFRN